MIKQVKKPGIVVTFWRSGVVGIPDAVCTSGTKAKEAALDFLRGLKCGPEWRACRMRLTGSPDGVIFRELVHPAHGVVARAAIYPRNYAAGDCHG